MLHIKNLEILVKDIGGISCHDKVIYAVDTKYFNKFYLPHNFLELVENKGYKLYEIETVTFYK